MLAWVIVGAVAVQYLVRPFFVAHVEHLDLAELLALLTTGGVLVWRRSLDKQHGLDHVDAR